MAKISPVSIKYMIYASFRAEGPLERPDVIGAVFGQTEGLLGSDMEMRELQKEGRIGRIEVDMEIVDGKSIGEIKIPTAMDKSETTLIAAALETIDRIGPTEAEIEINKIEDVRGTKRDFILGRAKELLGKLETGGSFGEMSKSVTEGSRIARIQEYGEEKLPAGDLSESEIIVVEGRADVVNLLKNRVNNVIGMSGTKLPAEIARLGEKKELTLFIDGDRGGKLIAKNVINNARVAYVAVAPDGKEVEELTGKEIHMSLRRKVRVSEFLRKVDLDRDNGIGLSMINGSKEEPAGDPKEIKEKMRELHKEMGSKNALLLNSELDVIKRVSAREISKAVKNLKRDIFALVLDGAVTSSLIKASEEKGIRFIGATNFGTIKETDIKLVSL